MKLAKKYLSLSVIFATALFLLLSPAYADGYQDKFDKDHRVEISIGEMAPDFTVNDVDGNEFTLSSMIGVKPIVLDFWATWCGPCRMELPLLSEFTGNHPEVGVYSITSEPEESHGDILTLFSDNDYLMNLVHDPSGDISTRYGVTAIPFLVVIGTDGKVIATHLGYSEESVTELEEDLGLTEPTE